MKKLLILLLLVSSVAFGKEGGNGGNAVVCRNGNRITSIELLDFYEARTLRATSIRDLSDRATLVQNVETLLQSLSTVSPARVRLYRIWWNNFFNEANLLRNVELISSGDSYHLSFPRGCRVEQVITQQEPKFAGDKRYTINRDLWDRLPVSQQAGLVLHELILREAQETRRAYPTLYAREINTVDIRHLTALVASGQIRRYTLFDLNNFVYKSEFLRFFEITGLSELIIPVVNDLYYSQDGREVISFRLSSESTLFWGRNRSRIAFRDVMINIEAGVALEFYRSSSGDVIRPIAQGLLGPRVSGMRYVYRHQAGYHRLVGTFNPQTPNTFESLELRSNRGFEARLQLHGRFNHSWTFDAYGPNCLDGQIAEDRRSGVSKAVFVLDPRRCSSTPAESQPYLPYDFDLIY
jgi:hypothetical protein